MKDIASLIAGFRRFRENYFSGESDLFAKLGRGQKPRTLVIACCDSRVDPLLLTDSGPGDIFVIRNVANLVPPYEPDAGYHGTSAAIEYAVCSLAVEHVIVLGHSCCGGIGALMSGRGCGEFVDKWVGLAASARDKVLAGLPGKAPELQARACELASILLSIENLFSFPFVRERVDKGRLFVHGWYFDIRAGELLHYCPDSGEFKPLVEGGEC